MRKLGAVICLPQRFQPLWAPSQHIHEFFTTEIYNQWHIQIPTPPTSTASWVRATKGVHLLYTPCKGEESLQWTSPKTAKIKTDLAHADMVALACHLWLTEVACSFKMTSIKNKKGKTNSWHKRSWICLSCTRETRKLNQLAINKTMTLNGHLHFDLAPPGNLRVVWEQEVRRSARMKQSN